MLAIRVGSAHILVCVFSLLLVQIVYALLSEGNGVRFPLLLLPADQYLISKRPMNVIAVTDSTGTAVFTQLAFQTR